MKKTPKLIALMALLVVNAPSFTQTPDLTGTWVLNLAKSALQHQANGLTGSIFIIRQTGDQFHLTRYHIFGEKKKGISFKMVADSRTRRVKLLFRGRLECKENSLQAVLWRKNFLNSVNYRFGTSEDELIADEVFQGKPHDHHNIWVFDRQPPTK